MVADLHGMTTPFDPKKIGLEAKQVLIEYLSVGLDPEKSVLFLQSGLADLHLELAYYFSTAMTVARIQHLPTYKEKVKQHPENVTMALLNYPVLMASDILIYKASVVPVGLDQEPHMEVTREIARKMNATYGTDFPEPKSFETKSRYVPSLTGEGKMSKSVEGSYINLTDSLEEIKGKLAKVPTDSGKGEKIPETGGIISLFQFVELFQGEGRRKEYEKQYQSTGIKYQELKEELAEVIYKELEPIQKRRNELEKKPKFVEKVLEEGAEKARSTASETVREVKEKIGLL
jgi:tryptophanyl-tRNA synthetase